MGGIPEGLQQCEGGKDNVRLILLSAIHVLQVHVMNTYGYLGTQLSELRYVYSVVFNRVLQLKGILSRPVFERY